MELVGKEVIHLSKYGEGTIIKQTDKKITVSFRNADGPKIFQYPDVFEKFLKLKDDDLNAQLNLELSQLKSQSNNEIIQESNARDSVEDENAKKKIRKVSVNTYSKVGSFCYAYENFVESEMNYLQKNGGKKYRLHDGIRIEDASKVNTIYTFDSETELNLPTGIEITVWNDDGISYGTIVDCDEFTVILSLETNYGKEIDDIEFSVNPWMIMNALIERLKEMAISPTEIAEDLILNGTKNIFYGYDYIDKGQDRAITMSLKQPITFIWGPPGTGKTQTLAKMAMEHIKKGEHVLMLSYSNVSVDGATLRLFNMMDKPKRGVVLRYGYPREKEVLNHPYLSSYNCVLLTYPSILKKRDVLIEERKKLSKDDKRTVEIARELNSLREHIKDLEKGLVEESAFVATTVSKAIMDSAIYNRKFDVVIFDEASMAYIPQLAFSANLSKREFICMGDFMQLPPIVQSSPVSSLNADIFQYSKVDYAVANEYGHDWLCMLDKQYRMHPDIAEFVSENMYHGLLKSADGMEEKVKEITDSEPFVGMPLVLADLSGMMSVCTTTIDKSHVNLLSALMTFSLALQAAEKNEVGIITPYSSQSRLIQAMIRDLKDRNTNLKPITSATVHQFQGSEKDIIIYDAVDCYRRPMPGVMLTSTFNNNANRLFNVAMTRAKGKFICVTNANYMSRKIKSPSLMFPKLIHKLVAENKRVEAKNLYSISNHNNVLTFYDRENGYKKYFEELKAAKKEIAIDIPDSMENDNNTKVLSKILSEAKDCGINLKVRTEKMESLPESLKPFAEEYPYLANPVTIIDKQIIWFGMPYSLANFKIEGKTIPTESRPIIRLEGKYTARVIYGILDIGRKIKA